MPRNIVPDAPGVGAPAPPATSDLDAELAADAGHGVDHEAGHRSRLGVVGRAPRAGSGARGRGLRRRRARALRRPAGAAGSAARRRPARLVGAALALRQPRPARASAAGRRRRRDRLAAVAGRPRRRPGAALGPCAALREPHMPLPCATATAPTPPTIAAPTMSTVRFGKNGTGDGEPPVGGRPSRPRSRASCSRCSRGRRGRPAHALAVADRRAVAPSSRGPCSRSCTGTSPSGRPRRPTPSTNSPNSKCGRRSHWLWMSVAVGEQRAAHRVGRRAARRTSR